MPVLDQVEQKFGFKLPPSYRALAEAGTLDEEFQLADGYIMTPQDLADFEWEDFMNPIEGLVPFAWNGSGEPYCWLTNETPTEDGELPIIVASHGGEGGLFAPTVTGTVCLNLVEWIELQAGDEAWLEDVPNDNEIQGVLSLLKAHAPESWLEAINRMLADFLKTDADGEPLLHSGPSYACDIWDDFGEPYNGPNTHITWETRQ